MTTPEEEISLEELKHIRWLSAPELRQIRLEQVRQANQEAAEARKLRIMQKIQHANNLGNNQITVKKNELDYDMKFQLRNLGYSITKPEYKGCLYRKKPNTRIIKWVLDAIKIGTEITDDIIEDLRKK